MNDRNMNDRNMNDRNGTRIVLVPGAFRGAWMWDFVVPLLSDAGHRPVAIDLSGRPGLPVPRLADWIADVIGWCDDDPRSTVVVGHSMGGVVARAATGVTNRIGRVVLLDAPVVESGRRAVDASGPAPAQLPPADTWLDPRPVGPEQGFESADLAAWVNERLVPTPLAPSLDPVDVDATVPMSVVFFDRTPSYFPSSMTRVDFDQRALPYRSLDAHHDAPLLDPNAVARLIVESID